MPVFASAFLLLVLHGLPQSSSSGPLQVSLCELMSKPADFDRQTVRIRGEVSLAFEDFTLHDSACPDDDAPWLAFGGDVNTPTVYCCGDHNKKKGSATAIEGIEVPIVKDKNFHGFVKSITEECPASTDDDAYEEGDHKRFRVTATLTGVFFAATKRTDHAGRLVSFSGFGHLGMSPGLLVITQVNAVDVAERPCTPAK